MSISVPIPFCFDYYSFVALSNIWKGYASSCVFLQYCFGNSEHLLCWWKKAGLSSPRVAIKHQSVNIYRRM